MNCTNLGSSKASNLVVVPVIPSSLLVFLQIRLVYLFSVRPVFSSLLPVSFLVLFDPPLFLFVHTFCARTHNSLRFPRLF